MCEVHTSIKTAGMPTWVRWIGVLPMALIGGLAGYWISRIAFILIFLRQGEDVTPGSISQFMLECFSSFASAALMIQFACRTAPGFRRCVYAVLVVLLCVYNFPAIRSLFVEFRLMVLIGLCGTALGAVAGASAWEGLKEDDETHI